MGKKRIDSWLARAMDALNTFVNVEDSNKKLPEGKTLGKYRNQISRFGAITALGSFKLAVKVFSEQNDCDVDVSNLLCAMHYIVTGNVERNATNIANAIINETDAVRLSELRDLYMDASVALKKSFNLFDLGKG